MRIGKEEEDAVLEVLRRDPVTLSGFYKNFNGGPSIQAFEQALVDYTGARWARTCSNGTSALHLALMASHVGRGMKVAVPPLTFSATATAVLMCGAEPIFVDVDEKTYNMNPKDLKHLLAKEIINAVIPVHLLGVPCEMNKIMHLANDYNFKVIEDNAQALGAKYRAAKMGAWGHFATLSFQETKSITTLGEGGAVLGTVDPGHGDRIASLRNHGQQYPSHGPGTEARETCWNYRMTEAQAAMGIVQLKKLDQFNNIQRSNRLILKEVLEPYGFVFQEALPDSYATYYLLGTTHHDADYRKRVVEALHAEGWGKPKPGATIGLGYTRTIMDLPLLRAYKRICPVAEWLVRHSVWWDCHRWISSDDFVVRAAAIDKIIKKVE